MQLKAIPASGYNFSGWKDEIDGDITDTADTVILLMTCSKIKIAVFTPIYYELKLIMKPGSGGQISIQPSQPDNQYTAGTVVKVTAVANEGYKFNGWTGDISGEEAVSEITMDGNKTITANFKGTHPASWWFRTIGIVLGILVFVGLVIFLIIRIINIKPKTS